MRHLRRQAQSDGLRFWGDEQPPGDFSDAFRGHVGPILGRALGQRREVAAGSAPSEAVPLGVLANWLLLLPGEDAALIGRADRALKNWTSTPGEKGKDTTLPAECDRVGDTRYARLHTSVRLAGPLEPEAEKKWLFLLASGFGGGYVEPDGVPAGLHILNPRKTRYIGVSRLGSCALGWIDPQRSNEEFEKTSWRTKYHGVYRYLALHALSEHESLLLRAAELAAYGPQLLANSAHTDIADLRSKLDKHVRRTVGRLLTVASGADCSASLPEYSDFYAAHRATHGAGALVESVRADLGDLVALSTRSTINSSAHANAPSRGCSASWPLSSRHSASPRASRRCSPTSS